MAQENKTETRLNVVRLSDVKVEEVKWLWEPYLPIGKVTILEGDPESGKSFLSLLIAAHVTRGSGLPAYGTKPAEKRQPRNVVILCGEDGTADTVKPRLLKVGGDDSRVFQLRGIIQTAKDGKTVELGLTLGQFGYIEQVLQEYQPELLIVDPFQSFVGEHVDLHRANEIRPVMDGLSNLGTKYGCAMLLIRHLNKQGGGNAVYRGLGSIDIYAAARCVLLSGKNPTPPSTGELFNGAKLVTDEKTRCVFAHMKCSLTRKGPSIAYEIDGNGLKLTGPVTVTADDILQVVPKLTARPDVQEWLTQFLADGPKSATEVKKAGSIHGFSERQLGKAADRILVERKPGGYGKGWVWCLPVLEGAA